MQSLIKIIWQTTATTYLLKHLSLHKKISNSRNISIEFKCFPLISYFCGILSIENWYQRPIKRKDEGDQSETQVTIYIKCLALKSSLRPIEVNAVFNQEFLCQMVLQKFHIFCLELKEKLLMYFWMKINYWIINLESVRSKAT